MAMKIFENPIIEIEKFEVADIITASGTNNNDNWDAGMEKLNWFPNLPGAEFSPEPIENRPECALHIRAFSLLKRVSVISHKQGK